MSSEFDALRRMLALVSGISLDADKTYLAESRLQPLLQNHGLGSLGDLVQRLSRGGNAPLMHEVVDAMTTNETFFFRDRFPFENFRTHMLPQLLEARQASRRIRIWCAAASSGQEPYSLAMILDEEAKRLSGWLVEIVATDISASIIEAAREGRYSQFEVQRGLPITHLLRYFQREGEHWRISEYLRSRVQFQQRNLLTSYADLGTFDVIFCRNVLIYFDVATKRDVLDRMAGILAPDGYFVMGSAEAVVGLTDALIPHPEHPSFNIPRTAAHREVGSALRLVANR